MANYEQHNVPEHVTFKERRVFATLFPHSRYEDIRSIPTLESRVSFFIESARMGMEVELLKASALRGEQHIHRITIAHVDQLHFHHYLDVTPLGTLAESHFHFQIESLEQKLMEGERLGGYGMVAVTNSLEMYVIGVEREQRPAALLWLIKGVHAVLPTLARRVVT